MRLDIAQMRAPGAFRLGDELHRLGGEPGRFAVFLGNVGRLVRIDHEPAGGDVIALHAGIGKVVPRVFSRVALLLQVFIVGTALAVIEPVRPFRPQPVIADPGVEPAFRLAHADHAVRRQSQPLHSFGVRHHVCLANQVAAHTCLAKMIAHGPLAHPQRVAVELHPVAGGVAPGIARHPRRAARGRLHISAGKAHPLGRKAIDMRGVQMRMACAAQVVEPQLVEHDVENVHRCLPHSAAALLNT